MFVALCIVLVMSSVMSYVLLFIMFHNCFLFEKLIYY